MGRKHITVLRHGNAEKASEEGHDADLVRPLSVRGRNQATSREARMQYPDFDRTASSPALRTLETAVLANGGRNVTPLDDLCFDDPTKSDDAAILDKAFNTFGYADVETYLTSEAAEAALRAADRMHAAVAAFINENDVDEKLLVVGHAVYSPLAFLPAVHGGKFEKRLRAISMPEAGGFLIVIEGGEVVHLEELPA